MCAQSGLTWIFFSVVFRNEGDTHTQKEVFLEMFPPATYLFWIEPITEYEWNGRKIFRTDTANKTLCSEGEEEKVLISYSGRINLFCSFALRNKTRVSLNFSGLQKTFDEGEMKTFNLSFPPPQNIARVRRLTSDSNRISGLRINETFHAQTEIRYIEAARPFDRGRWQRLIESLTHPERERELSALKGFFLLYTLTSKRKSLVDAVNKDTKKGF